MKIEFDMRTKMHGQSIRNDTIEEPKYEKMQLDSDFMNMDMNMDMDENDTKMEVDENDFSCYKQNKSNDMDLAKRDQYLLKIEDEIQLRRKFLLEKQKKLEKLSRQNHFLETIKNDYENYHNYIVEQKEGQIRAMNSIKQYVEDLIVSGKLTDEDIRHAKDDQREITSEVKKIREKINDIIGV
jgi:hypothetical protein